MLAASSDATATAEFKMHVTDSIHWSLFTATPGYLKFAHASSIVEGLVKCLYMQQLLPPGNSPLSPLICLKSYHPCLQLTQQGRPVVPLPLFDVYTTTVWIDRRVVETHVLIIAESSMTIVCPADLALLRPVSRTHLPARPVPRPSNLQPATLYTAPCNV
jgi:hypothetical protein